MKTVQGSLASFLWSAIKKISGGGMVIKKILNGEAQLNPEVRPLSLFILFLTEKKPLSFTFHLQMVPLSHAKFRTLQPF